MGERLPEGEEVTYRLEKGQHTPYAQLEVTSITLLSSPLAYQKGSLIAVNYNYICYVVKGIPINVRISMWPMGSAELFFLLERWFICHR